MRAVDLAVYADILAGRAAALSAQLERARGRLRQAGIERRASRELDPESVARLERLGLLASVDAAGERAAVADLTAALAAIGRLQAWLEAERVRAGPPTGAWVEDRGNGAGEASMVA